MPAPTRPCPACRQLVPQLLVEAPLFSVLVRALADGSSTLAAMELKGETSCSLPEATAWVNHLLTCTVAWPRSEADSKVLQALDAAFASVQKPDHFTQFDHCDECKEHDDTLRARTRETLRRSDLGNSGWDPISFCSPEGMGYFFPALARFALLPSVWKTHDWYGNQLMWHLSYAGSDNRFFQWCSPVQRTAVTALLRHLLDTRAEEMEIYLCEDELLAALDLWQAPSPASAINRT